MTSPTRAPPHLRTDGGLPAWTKHRTDGGCYRSSAGRPRSYLQSKTRARLLPDLSTSPMPPVVGSDTICWKDTGRQQAPPWGHDAVFQLPQARLRSAQRMHVLWAANAIIRDNTASKKSNAD